MMASRLHAPTADEKVDLTIRHYGTKAGKYNLYDDDGLSFDYEKGMYAWRSVLVKKNKHGQLTGEVSKPEHGKPNTYGTVRFEFMTK